MDSQWSSAAYTLVFLYSPLRSVAEAASEVSRGESASWDEQKKELMLQEGERGPWVSMKL